MNVKLDERYDFTSTERGFPPPTAGFSPPPTPPQGRSWPSVPRPPRRGCGCRCSGRPGLPSPAWRDLEPDKRPISLLKIADVIDENKELLATIESMDNGKPIRETMTIDVPLFLRSLPVFCRRHPHRGGEPPAS